MSGSVLTLETLKKAVASLSANKAAAPFVLHVNEEALKQNFGLSLEEAQALCSVKLVPSKDSSSR